MRMRWSLVLLVLLLGCATVNTQTGPGGVVYKAHDETRLALRFPLPETWTALWHETPDPKLVLANPTGTASLTIFLDPQAVSSQTVFENMLTRMKDDAQPAETLTGSVDGRKALGVRSRRAGRTATVFVVDHDRGIYVLLLDAATDADQLLLDFIFARLRFTE